MATDERWEVCAFFDFCKSNHIIDEMRRQDWEGFAKVYNGGGKAAEYGAKIEDYYNAAVLMNIPHPGHAVGVAAPLQAVAVSPAVNPSDGGTSATASAPAAVPGADATYIADFVAFVTGLGLRHFKPYELLTMGHQHNDPDSPAYGLNRAPPKAIWANIGSSRR